MGVWNPVSPETVARAELFAAEEKYRELLVRYDAEVSRSAGLQNRVWDLDRSIEAYSQENRMLKERNRRLSHRVADLEGHLTPARPWLVA